MKKRWIRLKEACERLRATGRLHNMGMMLLFVGIAAVFWLVMALNDSVQRNLTVRININGVPDSVKFITDPPVDMHVMVRDKGSSLMRTGTFRKPSISFTFKDYVHDGRLLLTHADLLAALKATFGGSASILSMSVDSVRVTYVSGKGRRVPVECAVNATPAAGSVIFGRPQAEPSRVVAYGPKNVLDTMTSVYTAHVTRRNLSEPTTLTVALHPVPGVRLEPSEVKVHIPVEPLVSKTFRVPLTTVNVPEGIELLLFPSTVAVNVFVPMSRFSADQTPVEAWVDYRDVPLPTDKVPVYVRTTSPDAIRATEEMDSVEYAVVK